MLHTSGGLLKLSQHSIKSCSSSQKAIALSSGEAELYALLKGQPRRKVWCLLLKDWSIVTQSVVNTDATAAMRIAYRSGRIDWTLLGRFAVRVFFMLMMFRSWGSSLSQKKHLSGRTSNRENRTEGFSYFRGF